MCALPRVKDFTSSHGETIEHWRNSIEHYPGRQCVCSQWQKFWLLVLTYLLSPFNLFLFQSRIVFLQGNEYGSFVKQVVSWIGLLIFKYWERNKTSVFSRQMRLRGCKSLTSKLTFRYCWVAVSHARLDRTKVGLDFRDINHHTLWSKLFSAWPEK